MQGKAANFCDHIFDDSSGRKDLYPADSKAGAKPTNFEHEKEP
jgi:hypothetical protein